MESAVHRLKPADPKTGVLRYRCVRGYMYKGTTCVYACVYIYIYVCINMCMRVCIYNFTCVDIYIYIGAYACIVGGGSSLCRCVRVDVGLSWGRSPLRADRARMVCSLMLQVHKHTVDLHYHQTLGIGASDPTPKTPNPRAQTHVAGIYAY